MMEEYYFLFGLALVYTLVAAIEDIRKTEVSNWLNFSFLFFALAFRAIYASIFDKWSFLLYGLYGLIIFFVLANIFYYSRIFGGGDAKLMMAIGTILPFDGIFSLSIISIEFILILFACGAIYSIIYSLILSLGKLKDIRKNLIVQIKRNKFGLVSSLILAGILVVLGTIVDFMSKIYLYGAAFLVIISFLYLYLKSVEDVCFIRLVSPSMLTEGDWLEKDVRVGNKVIRRTVHGLDYDEIRLLKKHNKKVLIKYGVPFVPAFLIALILMESFYLFSLFDFPSWLVSLF